MAAWETCCVSMLDMWDSVAPGWERHADLVDRHGAAATRRMLALAGIGAGDAVLELACGAGGAGLAAAELVGADGRVVLSDGAQQMVAVAARRAEGDPRISAEVVDLTAIDLPEASFDAVLCRQGLMLLDDPGAAMAAILRVLRPGGRLGVATWDRRAANPWLGLLFDAVGAQFGMEFPPPAVRGPFSLGDAGALGDLITGAGFEAVAVAVVAAPMRLASLDEWWARVPDLAGPLAQALAGMEPAVRESIRERAVAAARAAAREVAGGLELDGSIIVAAGRRPAA